MNALIHRGTILTLFAIASCSDSGPIKRIGDTSNGSAASKSWDGGVGLIFKNNCGSCHPGSRPTNYTLYANVSGSISAIVSTIDAGSMPPAGYTMTQADKDAIHAWVTAGTPETDTSPKATATPTPTTSATYALGVKPIMDASCTSCHSQAAGISPRLDTLADVKANYTAMMLRVNAGTMPSPVTATSKLSDAKIKILQDWGTAQYAP